MWIYFLLKKTISSPFFYHVKISRIARFCCSWITSFLRLRLEEVWSPNKRCHKLCATFYVLKLLSLFASCLLSYLFLCFSLSKRNSKMNNIHDFVWLIISTERKHIWGCFLFHFSFLKGFQVLVQPYLLFFPVKALRRRSSQGWEWARVKTLAQRIFLPFTVSSCAYYQTRHLQCVFCHSSGSTTNNNFWWLIKRISHKELRS